MNAPSVQANNQIFAISATGSSQPYANANANAAIDGQKGVRCNWDWTVSSVTHTNLEKDPWWLADFGSTQFVHTVKTYNRADCCGERLAGYQIAIGNDPNIFNNPVCPGVFTGEQTIECNLTGRYAGVFIISPSAILSLCEVEFFSS